MSMVAEEQKLIRIALLGNPNTGKSTVFNRLTGLRQHVANYPGITVEKRSGMMEVAGHRASLIDLPGAYSLGSASPEERIVMDVLGGRAGEAPDLLIGIVDATNLRRNLILIEQAAEFDIPMVVVLNQWDAAQKMAMSIDAKLLEERLGVPVIPTVAKSGFGFHDLKKALEQALEDPSFVRKVSWPHFVIQARDFLQDRLRRCGSQVTDAEALRLIFDTESTVEVGPTCRASLPDAQAKARAYLREQGLNPASAEAVIQYRHLDELLAGVLGVSSPSRRLRNHIDAVLLHRFWGTLFFFGVMYLVFQSLYAWAGPLMDLIDAGTTAVQGVVSPMLGGMPMLQSLVSDGIIAGVGGVVIFLPQILILFLFIAILEDTGYLARAAFLMDKLFGWCGLNGKSFVPLLSGYACAIPGIMAARTLEDPKARITTVLLTPLMSCSARLPVYVLLIGAFIEPTYGPFVAGCALFLAHFIGAAAAIPIAWVLNRYILKVKALPFILEMPDYRFPTFRNVITRMWERGREFLIRAGTVILAFSIIIWALLYFPRPESLAESAKAEFVAEESKALPESVVKKALEDPDSELSAKLSHLTEGEYLEQSYLGRFGKAVQPVFDPAGFDWKITVGVLSSFPAREVIIATLGIIYHLGADVDEGSDDLRSILARETWQEGPRAGQPVYTIPTVLSVIVFFALCLQCGATVATVAKELNWRWAAISFAGQTVLAWIAAVLVYQIGSLF